MRPKCSTERTSVGQRRRLLLLPAFAVALHRQGILAAARRDDGQRLLLGEEPGRRPVQLAALAIRLAVPARRPARNLVLGELPEGLLVVPLGFGLSVGLDLGQLAEEDDPPGELSLVRIEVVLRGGVDEHRRRPHRTVGSRRPRLGQGQQLRLVRRRHPHGRNLVLPPAPEGTPAFLMRVREPPARELRLRPVVGALHSGRAGQARADAVHELARQRHDLRIAEPLVADARDHVEVDALLSGDRRGDQGERGEHEAGRTLQGFLLRADKPGQPTMGACPGQHRREERGRRPLNARRKDSARSARPARSTAARSGSPRPSRAQ